MSGNTETRVLLADDHTLVRAGVRRILEGHPGIRVVGEVADGAAALAALAREPADVLVLDLSMPGMDGFETLRRVRAVAPGIKVLVLSMHADAEYVARAVREGADGYLLKDSAVQDLVRAIETVREGGVYHSPEVQRKMAEMVRGVTPVPVLLDELTAREREVLRCIAEGLATKDIAAKFGISARTVETHRANLMRKLTVHSVAQLVRIAIREGLVGPA
ncbi:MAG: response regulator transcription factor [Candidatus Eisenbacteria bacterium]